MWKLSPDKEVSGIFEKSKKGMRYKESLFPKAYIGVDLQNKIETVNCYFKFLETPEKNLKVSKAQVPKRHFRMQKINFNFRSASSAKEQNRDQNKGTLRKYESVRKLRTGDRRQARSMESSAFTRLLRIASFKVFSNTKTRFN